MGKKVVQFSLLFVLFFLTWLPDRTNAQEQTHEQLRAFWVDAFHDGIKTPEQVDQLLKDVHDANANTVIVQVRRRGDAYFNKSLEPRTQDPRLKQGFDALQDLIDKAHAMEPKIEVHAWLATLPIWNSLYPPIDANHVFNQHGPSSEGADFWLMTRYDGVIRAGADYVLDPGHPDALDYTVEQYVNVVKEYDVDGIHLDLARYMGTDWGYNPTSVERFQKEYKMADIPKPADQNWGSWRRDQVNNLVRKTYLNAIAVKPEVKVTVATIAWGAGPETQDDYEKTRTMTEVFQDWQGVLKEEIIDMAIPMNYNREHVELQKKWYDQWIAWEKKNQFNRQIAAGPAAYLNSINNTLNQTKRALEANEDGEQLAGVSFYSYAVTNVDNEPIENFINALSTAVFEQKVRVPEMPWKTNPITGYLMGVLEDQSGQLVGDTMIELKGEEGFAKFIKTDGNGWFGVSKLTPGNYIIKYKTESTNAPTVHVKVEAGKVTTAEIQANK
ncbi:family 10 glycosylhydrolase [Bacillus aquiflavi]|uniref:family 10 glycosylhydrolase n=1 Tax=Bacillus aquiflavi TaxID=2672567 RepID=UPI001CA99B02|nr:family 10 glycosylhydrolase [Bacillus aquiflavi]UAC49540.1 family 10 glycosylhydrolase [Bacillus aquiflavi]